MTIDRNTTNWTFETDIAVVGSGGCGLTAAIAAAQGGAEVIVFEKQERPLSNTARSGGMIPAAGTRFQKTAGIEESPQDLAADIFRKNHHASDPELTLHLARTARQMVEWLVDDVGVARTGLRGAAVIDDKLVHVLADGSPAPIARALRLLIDATQADPV